MKAEPFVHCAPVLVGVVLAPVLSYRKRLRGRISHFAYLLNYYKVTIIIAYLKELFILS